MNINNNKKEDGSLKIESEHGVVVNGDAVNSTIISGSHNVIKTIIRTPEQERAEKNRRAMLEVVENTWVKGFLEKSIYHEMLIDLGLEERPDAVTRPWDVQMQMPDRPNRILPLGTPIVQVFKEIGGDLLILGAPGAGKTIMLLELARDCIADAMSDDSLPIPVVFNLSSYANPKQTLERWLANELMEKYQIPKKVAGGWVKNGGLLLLLDGLDEVKAECRDACVEAINNFHQSHGLTMRLVVCSRTVDYEALSTRLQLHGAVLLQPLTDHQIDTYFEHAGLELTSVHLAWRQDTELQELARQPLMLSIMTLAYRGITPESLLNEQAGSLLDRRKNLFDAYIVQMFARVGRAKDKRYSAEESKNWLIWLSQKMTEQGESIFLLENMRRSWLPLWQRRLHRLIGGLLVGSLFGLLFGMLLGVFGGPVFGVLGGLEFALLFGVEFALELRLIKGFLFGLCFGLYFGFLCGLFFGVFSGLLFGLMVTVEIWMIAGPVFGVVAGLISWWIGWLIVPLIWGPGFGMWFGLIFGLVGGFVNGRMNEVPTERVKWSWRKAGGRLLIGLVVGLTIALSLVVFLGISFMLSIGSEILPTQQVPPMNELVDMLLSGLMLVFALGLAFGSVGGFVASDIVEDKVTPNQGIHRSLKNACVYGLVVGIVGWLVYGLMNGADVMKIAEQWNVLLISGLLFGVLFWLIYGGSAVINHYILRSFLHSNQYAPRNYEHFLNYAVEHLFLHQVGGGYMFVHRLLMEHFAGLAPKK